MISFHILMMYNESFLYKDWTFITWSSSIYFVIFHDYVLCMLWCRQLQITSVTKIRFYTWWSVPHHVSITLISDVAMYKDGTISSMNHMTLTNHKEGVAPRSSFLLSLGSSSLGCAVWTRRGPAHGVSDYWQKSLMMTLWHVSTRVRGSSVVGAMSEVSMRPRWSCSLVWWVE